jgi:hypothetical protein
MMRKPNWPLFWLCLIMMMADGFMIIAQLGMIDFPSPGFAMTVYAVLGVANLAAIIYLARMLKQAQTPH